MSGRAILFVRTAIPRNANVLWQLVVVTYLLNVGARDHHPGVVDNHIVSGDRANAAAARQT